MKVISLLAAAAVAASAGSAFAADLASTKAPAAPVVVSPWDWDIGAGVTSNYIFRGITQSNNGPSVAGHGEVRYNVDSTWQLYLGMSGESINFNADTSSLRVPGSNALLGSTYGNPTMELDGDAGVRGTFDKFSFDLGAIVYSYPSTPATYWPRTYTWEEVYIKPSYTVTDWLTLGANFFYTPSYSNSGASAEYLSGTFKATLPGDFSAFSVSGEFGRQFFNGKVDSVIAGTGVNSAAPPAFGGNLTGFAAQNAGFALGEYPSYNTWNVGVAYNWKFLTLDLRYWGTNLSGAQAAQLWGVAGYDLAPSRTQNRSDFGENRFVATLSFDLTSKDLK
jgi:uncharacterized protein (TIGR02001 family)